MQTLIILIALFFSFACQTTLAHTHSPILNINAQQLTRHISAFSGGLNRRKIKKCHTAMRKFCGKLSTMVNYPNCIRGKMATNKMCSQNLALLNRAAGFFTKIKHYPYADVAKTVVLAADHTYEFFIVTHRGELVKLANNYEFKNNSKYRSLVKAFPNVNIWPIAFDFPKKESLPNGEVRLIFKQLLLNGCFACERAGFAYVAYDLARSEHLVDVELLSVVR